MILPLASGLDRNETREEERDYGDSEAALAIISATALARSVHPLALADSPHAGRISVYIDLPPLRAGSRSDPKIFKYSQRILPWGICCYASPRPAPSGRRWISSARRPRRSALASTSPIALYAELAELI